MTSAKLRYTVKKRGNLFWQPTPEMRKMGFEPKALGPDTPASQAQALKLYEAWLKAKAERGKVTSYPPGTFGAYFDRFKRTTTYAKKAVRTREDYERAWVHIDAWRPAPDSFSFSRTVITSITTELCEQFYDHLEKTVSPNERHRTIKWLKVLLADAIVRLRLPYASPAAKLVNPQPAGRSAIWLGAEIDVLAKTAKELGYQGMSLAIRIGWETMFSPVDIWTCRRGWMKRDGVGWYLARERTKTSKETFGALSDELAEDLLAYMKAQPFEYTDETPIIRQRNGKAYRSKDTFGDDFRDVRKAAYPGDTRRFQDIRRSANVEADAAGADKETMGKLLANGLAANKFIDDTYTPPTVAKAREVAAQRIEGRAKLAGEVTRRKDIV